MLKFQNTWILFLVIISMFSCSQSTEYRRSKRKRLEESGNQNDKFEVKVGLGGILKYCGREIEFKVLKIKESGKYKHFVEYPGNEYVGNAIHLDLKKLIYHTPAQLRAGKIIHIFSKGLGKWDFIPYVGLKGILSYRDKNIEFKIEKINETKDKKYEYFLKYPNYELFSEWMHLDLKKRKYNGFKENGKILDIFPNFDHAKEDTHLTYLKDIDTMKLKIKPYEKMSGILYDDKTIFDIVFEIERIEHNFIKENAYKYFLSCPENETLDKKWVQFNFDKKTYRTKDKISKGTIMAINRIDLEKRTDEEISNLKKNRKLCSGVKGRLYPNSFDSTNTSEEFTIIKVETQKEDITEDSEKIYWVTYPKNEKKQDEYLAFNLLNFTFFGSEINKGTFTLEKALQNASFSCCSQESVDNSEMNLQKYLKI